MNRIKTLMIFFGLMAISSAMHAQDLVVTTNGDTLECKIIRITESHVEYNILRNNKVRTAMRIRDDIRYFEKGYYLNNHAIPTNDFDAENNVAYYTKKNPFNVDRPTKIGVVVGPAWRTFKIPSDINQEGKDFYTEMKSGTYWGTFLSFRISDLLYLGGRFNRYSSQHQITTTYFYENGNSFRDVYGEKLTVSSLSLNFEGNAPLSNKFNYSFGIGLGYTWYHNLINTPGPVEIKANSVYFSFESGIHYQASDHVDIGLSFMMGTGSFKDYTYSHDYGNGEEQLIEAEDLSYFVPGLMFTFYP